jgi:nicotinate-nucleotide adenylyltransferase
MKIGLYFGSFNPIHIGHLIIAQHVLNETDINKVWFVVSPQNPLKESKDLLDEYKRFHLVQIAIENNHNFFASNIEFKLPRPSYTTDTLTYLQEKYPQHKFSIIMGGDSYTNLPKWKNYIHILNNYEIVVYNRPGFEITPYKHSNTIKLNAPLLNISATQIRKLIEQRKEINYLVTEEVRKELINNNLYKNNTR